jgi:thioesterase domain-containing protein
MSLHPSLVEPVPEQTAQIAHTAFPKGSPYLTLRDEPGTLYLTMIFRRSFLSAANRRSRRGVWHSSPFSNFAKVSRTARPPKPCALASIGNICWGLSLRIPASTFPYSASFARASLQARPKSKGERVLSIELQNYLHDHSPLSKAMEVSVMSVQENAVVLPTPLGPNINHRETVFGGSASALAILAAWSLLYARLRTEGINSRLVIQRNTMEHEQPILGELIARVSLDNPEEWQKFK